MHDRSRIILNTIKDSSYAPHLQFWFQCGTQDEIADRNKNGVIDSIDDTMDVIRELERKGYDPARAIFYLEVDGGKHDLQTWAKVFPDFLKWAFKKRL
jgi:enterochelin esterase-like enzyme